MNKLEIKREELAKVSTIAPKGSHVEVANKVGISTQYLYQIRFGKNATINDKDNNKLLQNLINAYRKIIRREQEKYKSI